MAIGAIWAETVAGPGVLRAVGLGKSISYRSLPWRLIHLRILIDVHYCHLLWSPWSHEIRRKVEVYRGWNGRQRSWHRGHFMSSGGIHSRCFSWGADSFWPELCNNNQKIFTWSDDTSGVKTSTLKDDKKRVMVEIPSACKPLPKQWFRQDRYRLIVARRWKYRSEHINLKEGRVSLMGLRRHARSKNSLGTRLLTISDNMSSLLAFSKGRSKSFALNQLVRRAAAYSVGLRIQWCLRHVKSEDNASDESSRWHDPAVMQAWLQRRAQSTTPPKQKRYAAEVPLGGGQPMKVDEKDQPGADNDEVKRVGRIRSLVSYLPLFFWSCLLDQGDWLAVWVDWAWMCWIPFEIFDGWEFDLCRPQTQALLIELIRMGLVWYIHAGVPCTVWSRARHNISNHVKARAKEKVAIELTMFCVALFRAQSRVGWYWSMENPASSRIFEFRPIVELSCSSSCSACSFHMCQYGQPFKKPTAILTNLSSLLALARKCQGGHKHVQLVGREQYKTNDGRVSWRNKTAAAGEYPPSLTRVWANILEKEAPDAARFPDVSKIPRVFSQTPPRDCWGVWPKTRRPSKLFRPPTIWLPSQEGQQISLSGRLRAAHSERSGMAPKARGVKSVPTEGRTARVTLWQPSS